MLQSPEGCGWAVWLGCAIEEEDADGQDASEGLPLGVLSRAHYGNASSPFYTVAACMPYGTYTQ